MFRGIATTVLAGAGAIALSTGAFAETVFNYSTWVPPTHPININLYIPWMKLIEKETDGRVKFRVLPKPVASPRAHLDAVRTGQADLAFSVHGYSPRRFAAYLFAELPGIGDTAVASSVALQRTHDKLLADKGYYTGVHLIGMNTHGPGLFHHSKKNIMSPDDLKGEKIRTGGPVPKAIVEAWGGVPIRQPAPKSYEILSNGTATGITFPYESLVSFKILNLVPYSTYVPGGLYSSSHYLVMNQAKYDSLSAEDKAVVDKYSGEAFARMAGAGWDKINDEGKAAAEKAGNHIMIAPKAVIDAAKELTKKLEADYIDGAKAVNVDGAEVLKYYHAELKKLSGN